MSQYVVEVPHSPNECPNRRPVRWTTYHGCRSGTHTSWTIAELASDDDAWALVPELLRDTARVVLVERAEPPSAELAVHRAASPRRGEQDCGEEV